MAQQIVNVGAVANDGTGDTWRDALIKLNANDTELYTITDFTKRVLVNELSDFPTPAAGVITLAASTQYLLANDIALGTNRLVFSQGTALGGISSIVVSLTYTGTGDMLTFPDVLARVDDLTLDAPSGMVFNYTQTTSGIFRVTNVSVVSCNKIGLFNGTNAVMRFSNFSPASVTSDGLEFTGNFRSVFYEGSAATIGAGALFNLGTATFDSFILVTVLATLNGTSNLISGATGSANINADGLGIVERALTSGAGTPLSGISVEDSLWQFDSNDDIADTRPDSLISMQANATNTVIAATSTPVLVAGTWVLQGDSQFSFTAAGRMTYTGGRDARLPVMFSCSLEPASGTNILMSVLIAINGSVVAASQRNGTGSAGSPTSITAPWQYTFSTGDYVEVFVQNIDTTANILVSSAIGRIN